MISNTNLMIIAIIIIALIFLYRKQENFTSTESNEAVQNIASVYADTSGTVSFNNITVTGKTYSPTQKYYTQLGDDGNLCIYDMNGNKVSCMGPSGFINPTNPVLGFGGTGYYVVLQSNGDLCVNNGKGAGGNLGCIGNSGVLGVRVCDLNGTCIAPNNIQSESSFNSNIANVMRSNTSYGYNYYGGHNDTYVFYPKQTT